MDTAHEDFTEFVHATAPRLHRTALMLAGDAHLAEDLLQTTYARLFASWAKVRRADNPVGYAQTTLTHVFVSHRRLKRTHERPTSDLAPPSRRERVGSEDRLDLLAALRTLPELDRTILVLRYCDDRTVDETAAAVGLTPVAVRSRASRALARLRPHLTALQEDPR